MPSPGQTSTLPRVDFYSLPPGGRTNRFVLACRIVERAYAAALRTLVLTPDQQTAHHMDRLLWTYRQQSFLPHALIGAANRSLTPILIAAGMSEIEPTPVLLNLTTEIPADINRFERIAHPIDDAVRSVGREHYRHYRDLGCELHHHDMG